MRVNELDELADRIDAAVFSSDSLFDEEFRKILRFYCDRWVKSLDDHENTNWEN